MEEDGATLTLMDPGSADSTAGAGLSRDGAPSRHAGGVNPLPPVGEGRYEAFLAHCANAGVEVATRRISGWEATSLQRRQRESAAARDLARALLRPHGIVAAPLLRHAKGFPLWPEGWVGSLAHSAGWCAVAQARVARTRGVGVDVEDPARMRREMWAHLLTPDEVAAIASTPETAHAAAATAVFCAKEAFFKAVFPLDQRVPGFLDVAVAWRDDGAFRLRCVAPSPGGTFAVETVEGGVATCTGVVVAAAWVPAG